MEPLKHLSCAEWMLRSQSPSPYLEVPLEASPSWCWAASLSRASAPGLGPEVLPARCPQDAAAPGGGGGGRWVLIRGGSWEAEASGRAGAWRGPSLPPRSFPRGPSPGARCRPYQVLGAEALHPALRPRVRALGAHAEPTAGRPGARQSSGGKGHSAAPRPPSGATDFAPGAAPRAPRPPRAPGPPASTSARWGAREARVAR